ncbi:uncharacterized protein CLUP02_02575 [Colletotrichum lupini]|uniref:Uncharacterized protein n=1 Tax=Colletotrichum lupini TaxID=145971 RepID=A0A9Q8WAX9_9PEZI|nr:uncharacterized protein CLUP02_02575 [Colletotrichum lupini]UQC77108.1 hypothetical protein CLUP02_02575 [Colletotrichum lupini]
MFDGRIHCWQVGVRAGVQVGTRQLRRPIDEKGHLSGRPEFVRLLLRRDQFNKYIIIREYVREPLPSRAPKQNWKYSQGHTQAYKYNTPSAVKEAGALSQSFEAGPSPRISFFRALSYPAYRYAVPAAHLRAMANMWTGMIR